MSAELVGWLQESTLASSAAALLVLALRRPWRHWLGARSVPWLWLLVPAAIVAVSVPAPSTGDPALAVLGVLRVEATTSTDTIIDWPIGSGSTVAIGSWLAGMLVMVLMLGRAQRRFRLALGRLRPGPDGSWIAERSGIGPAVIGWLSPRIIVPADFDERYDAEQQRLVLAHERCHVRRGDLHVSLLASALRCLYWFNPVLHLAARQLRFDLELACDAATLASHPKSRRSYADAMLNTQLAELGLPVGCYWQSSHPLKKRIAMMKRPVAGPSRMLLAAAITCCLTAATGVTAWASQGASSDEQPSSTALPSETTYRQLKPPKYPQHALDEKLSGSVLLKVKVGADGSPQAVEVERSSPAGVFDTAAIEAVSTWRFNPATSGGKPVAGWVHVPIEFSITDEPVDDGGPLPETALDEIYIRGGTS